MRSSPPIIYRCQLQYLSSSPSVLIHNNNCFSFDCVSTISSSRHSGRITPFPELCGFQVNLKRKPHHARRRMHVEESTEEYGYPEAGNEVGRHGLVIGNHAEKESSVLSDKLQQEIKSDLERLIETSTRLDDRNAHVGFSSYASLLRACGDAKALSQGRRAHFHVIRSEHARNRLLGNLLVEMYGKCGALEDARSVFEKMAHLRNVFSWAIIITAYAKHGRGNEALRLYRQMRREGWKPDKIVFVNILSVCSSPADLEEGVEIHASIVAGGWISDVVVATALVNMYGKCGNVASARHVFNTICSPDLVSWNAMITVYGQHGYLKEAIHLYHQMCIERQMPNKVTFISILNACAEPATLEEGRELHAKVIVFGFEWDSNMSSALVGMYSKCGSLADAWRIFCVSSMQTLDLWNAMIGACTEHGHDKVAFNLYRQMLSRGMKPDKITFISILCAFSSPANLTQGKEIHANVMDFGFDSDAVVGTALVDMYIKSGSREDALRVFAKVDDRDVVLWTTIISAYMEDGSDMEALQLFNQMQQERVTPDRLAYINIICACANMAVLEQGKEIHASLAEIGLELDITISNALVNMYGKCGYLEDAWRAFIQICKRDVVSWTAIIAAYAQQGCGREALHFFQNMKLEGVKPDEITFISVLHACSHTGLVQEGIQHFNSLSEHYGILPTGEHCACMIDIFGRAGLLEEAESFIVNRSSLQPNWMMWLTLLGACRIHGDVDRGKHAAGQVIEVGPGSTAPYVLLSNIYSTDEL